MIRYLDAESRRYIQCDESGEEQWMNPECWCFGTSMDDHLRYFNINESCESSSSDRTLMEARNRNYRFETTENAMENDCGCKCDTNIQSIDNGFYFNRFTLCNSLSVDGIGEEVFISTETLEMSEGIMFTDTRQWTICVVLGIGWILAMFLGVFWYRKVVWQSDMIHPEKAAIM